MSGVLSDAVSQGDMATVDLLLQYGTNVNASFGGETPLMLATDAAKSPLSMLKTLLKHGANVNATDDGAETALMYVAEDVYPHITPGRAQQNLEMIRLLLRHHVDAARRNDHGRTALQMVRAELAGYPQSAWAARPMMALLQPPSRLALDTPHAHRPFGLLDNMRIPGL